MLINIDLLERMSSNIIGRLRYNYQCINRVRLQEDESKDCSLMPQYSCTEWLARGVQDDGEYLIDLSLNGNSPTDYI
jgi:hypothetical protein